MYRSFGWTDWTLGPFAFEGQVIGVWVSCVDKRTMNKRAGWRLKAIGYGECESTGMIWILEVERRNRVWYSKLSSELRHICKENVTCPNLYVESSVIDRWSVGRTNWSCIALGSTRQGGGGAKRKAVPGSTCLTRDYFYGVDDKI